MVGFHIVAMYNNNWKKEGLRIDKKQFLLLPNGRSRQPLTSYIVEASQA